MQQLVSTIIVLWGLQKQIIASLDDHVAGHTSVLLVTPCLEMHQHIFLLWQLL